MFSSTTTVKHRMRDCTRVISLLFPFTIVLLFAMPPHTFAQVRGLYSSGSTLTDGGTLSDPGFSFENQFWYNSASQLKGPHGNSLPIQGSVSSLYDSSSLIYVPKFKLLHANLEFSVDISVTKGSYAVRDPLLVGPGISANDAGLTNTSFVPFDLGWHFKWIDLQTGYSVSAPTGRYVPGASNNLSTGFWTNSWQSGATIYLSKSKATQLSVFDSYAWNATQQGTGIRPGQNNSVDYSVSQTFILSKNGEWALLLGAAGYGQWQTTKNTGQSPEREALKYGVDAGGFTVVLSAPFKALQVGASVLWEYAARNTYQGRTFVLTAGFDF
jgi:hypothetical protein